MWALSFILTQVCKRAFSAPYQHYGEMAKLVFSLWEGLCKDDLTENNRDFLFAGWMAISLLCEGLSLLKPCPTVHNMWNWSFLKECFFLCFLHLWKESWEEKYKRSQNTYYSRCDSAGNRRARKESKIEISQEGAEEGRQERSLVSYRETRIICLFIDLTITWKDELWSLK